MPELQCNHPAPWWWQPECNAGCQDEPVPDIIYSQMLKAGTATDLQYLLEHCTYASATLRLFQYPYMVDRSNNEKNVQYMI